MKTKFLLLAITLLLFASCHTKEKIVYFQDIEGQSSIPTQARTALTLKPGDKVGVMVTSAKTPELATRFNINPGTSGSSLATSLQDNMRYIVDENGDIDVIGIGRIHVGGLTRSEAAKTIQDAFRAGVLNDAVITVGSYNQYVTVLGDVAKPGQVEITKDNMTILEALGKVGDLNITGRRDCIKVIRQEGNESKVYFVDLRSKDLLSSPVYNLMQNDVIYVEPNRVKMGQSTNNDNSVRSIATWLSVTSVITSITILITNAIKD